MTFVTGRIRTPLTEKAYQARMPDFHREERKGRQISCHVCQEEMVVESLKSYLATQHDVYQCFVAPGVDQAGSGDGTTWTARFSRLRVTIGAPYPIAARARGDGVQNLF